MNDIFYFTYADDKEQYKRADKINEAVPRAANEYVPWLYYDCLFGGKNIIGLFLTR